MLDRNDLQNYIMYLLKQTVVSDRNIPWFLGMNDVYTCKYTKR